MIELKHLSKTYHSSAGTVEALKDISLTIDERFVAITGPNGGGKSTLAKVIAGILPPTQGRILFDGEDITGLSITDRARRGISFAFQQPVRFKGLTVRDLVEHVEPVAVEAAQHGLDFGVAETDVEFKHLRLAAADHDADEDHAAEIEFFSLDALQERRQDFIVNLPPDAVIHHRGGGISAHAAGIEPGVAVADALVVLRRDQRHDRLAVAEREDRRLFAVQALLDQHLRSG